MFSVLTSDIPLGAPGFPGPGCREPSQPSCLGPAGFHPSRGVGAPRFTKNQGLAEPSASWCARSYPKRQARQGQVASDAGDRR